MYSAFDPTNLCRRFPQKGKGEDMQCLDINANGSQHLLRVLVPSILAVLFLLLSPRSAWAHAFPVGCSGNSKLVFSEIAESNPSRCAANCFVHVGDTIHWGVIFGPVQTPPISCDFFGVS